jgi:hypothetical protein
MIHDGERLSLGLEPRHHLPRVHARLKNFQRHLAAHWQGLLGYEHDPKTSLADLPQYLVWPDNRTVRFNDFSLLDGYRWPCNSNRAAPREWTNPCYGRLLQKASRLDMSAQELGNVTP